MTFAQPFTGYEILARVGAGAMGTVFRARQEHMDRIVAIKVLKRSLARNEQYVERLRREARIVGGLNHPNIVTGYDLGEEGGYHFFVMEFVEGKSLRALLAEWGYFPSEQVLDVGIQVSEALDHAFRHGIIHRDIKPGNILIDDEGHVKLTDMGLAKGPDDMTLTRDGATVGTPQFISPEQARDPRAVDVRSDLYSLGATLYQMTTGTAPFQAETIGELIHHVLHTPAPDVRELTPGVGDGLALVIKKLLMKDPELRYQTPAELLEDLRRVQRDERPVVDVSRLERAERLGGRSGSTGSAGRRRLLLTAGVIVAMLWIAWWGVGGIDEADSVQGARAADRAEAERTVASALASADSIRGRFDALRRLRMRSRGDAGLLAVIEQAEQRVISELRERIDASAARALQSSAVDRCIHSPERWADVEGCARDAMQDAVSLETGYLPGALPADVREDWLRAEARVAVAVGERAQRRDREYEERFRRHLDETLDRALERALREDRFESVRRELRDGPGKFHGTEGRPTLIQLGDALRLRLEERTTEWAARWARRADEAETRVAERFATEVDEEVAAVRVADARDDEPEALLRRIVHYRDVDLPARYPLSVEFSAGRDPWPHALGAIERLARDLSYRRLERDRRSLTRDIEFGYELLAGAGVDAAVGFFRDRAEQLDLERARQHLALIEAAAVVRRHALRRLLGGLEKRDVQLRQVRGILVLKTETGLETRNPQNGEQVPFAVVAGPILETVGGQVRSDVGEDAAQRAGLALWWLIAGEKRRAIELVHDDEARRDFFAKDVVAQVAALRVRPLGAVRPEQESMLADLVRARQLDDAGAATQVLERLRERVGGGPPLSESDRGIVEDVQAWVRREERRTARQNQMRRAAPRGARISLDQDGTERVTYTGTAFATLNDRLGAWRAAGDSAGGIALRSPAMSAEEAWDRRLELDTVVDAARGLRCSLRLELLPVSSVPVGETPVASNVPQLFLGSLRGADFALVALPDGRVIAEGLDAAARRDASALRDAVSGRLAVSDPGPSAWLVPGAVHELTVILAGTGRTRMRVALDGTTLLDRRVQIGAEAPTRLALAPFQAVTLRQLVIASGL